MAWTPQFKLDLSTASTGAFNKLLEDFEAWRVTQQANLPAVDLTNGWKIVTPEMAEAMLLRNPVGANRRPTLPTVKYYARQMAAGDWKKTGQPIIFDTDGVLRDAGHRNWASYLSGASFPTFLVGDVPPDPTLFAYIDNCKARSASDALSTAGLNGLAKTISTIVNIAMHYEHHLYQSTTKKTMHKVSPIEVVHYATEHENLRLGARLMAGEYKAASTVVGYKDVAAFAAYQIIELYGEETLETFMTELGKVSDDDPVEGSPIAAFQKVMEEDEKSKAPMLKHQVLGHLIKTFNSWHSGEAVKRITLRVNETFPRFIVPRPMAQAAE